MKNEALVGLMVCIIIASLGISRSIAASRAENASNTMYLSLGADPTPYFTLPPSYTPAYLQPNDDQLEDYNRQFDAPSCTMPCLWGMTPGVSRLEDVYALFQSAGFLGNLDEGGVLMFGHGGEREINSGGIGFQFGGVSQSTSVTFRLVDDVLASASLRAESPSLWQDVNTSPLRLSTVLSQLESIPEMYMVGVRPHGLWLNFLGMMLYFREEGVLLVYQFDFSGDWETQPSSGGLPELRRTCPTLTNTWRLTWHFWDASRYDWNDVITEISSLEYYPTVDEVLGISAATFVQYFRAHPDGCIESAVSDTYYMGE